MKKLAKLLLLVVLLLSACTSKNYPQWSREGYFVDDNNNFVSIMASQDENNPGWYVGCMLEGGTMYGALIQQEKDTLHGNINTDTQGEAFVITVSEEGEDGIVFAIENGETYHLTHYEIPDAAFVLRVNTEGFGQLAYTRGEEEPEFSEDFPTQSIYEGLAEAEVFTISAKPDDGYKFMKWTYNGEDYSTEETITLEVNENVDLVAVFGIKGKDETHVDLDSVTKLGQLLGLPIYGYSASEPTYVLAFEQDGHYYQAICDLPADVANELFSLDWEDPEREEKEEALIKDLNVTKIIDLSAGLPTREDMDALVGKSGAELFDAGWYVSGWDLENMSFYLNKGAYEYTVKMEGEITKSWSEFEEEDIRPLVISEVESVRIANHSSID